MAKKPIKTVNLLPEFLQTDRNEKFLASTIDQLIQPPELERIDGFIGSKLTPTYVSTSDIYLSESFPLRRDYQLEPALVIKDELGNIEQVKAIDDLVNEINVSVGLLNNYDTAFRSQFYSYNPHIDFDKFVNYQQYYWLTTGPDTVVITGEQRNTTSTYTVVDNEIKSAWVFSPDGLTEDPLLVLYRGNTYNFVVRSNYKFYIKSSPTLGLDDVYTSNVSGNGTSVVTITIDQNTLGTLYYTSDEQNYTQGKIVIKDSYEDSYIDVEEEILGKKTYKSGTGISLSNGMKIRFEGDVYPVFYRDKEFFVEGVGSAIRLVEYSLLTGSEKLTAVYNDNFDANPFDQYPFEKFRQLPIDPEYITINRASRDLNPWSRYNRWVHEDVIRTSALANNLNPVYPLDKRAKRPIIEFNADLQLYNFGSFGVKGVDLIDTTTKDAFSVVEGSAGYYVDGILLEQGNRVIFNADTDSLVRGRIYKVNYRIIKGVYYLELQKTEDHIPPVGASLTVLKGDTYKDTEMYFDGNSWVMGQQHTKLNQPPLFDVFDGNGTSYSDKTVYNTDFVGTKIFGYEEGSIYDPVLGFNVKYKTNSVGQQSAYLVGSYLFKNYFNTDTFSLYENNTVTTINTELSYLRYNNTSGYDFKNVWETQTEPYQIPILQTFYPTGTTSRVEITAINNPYQSNFNILVYVNNLALPKSEYSIKSAARSVYVEFSKSLTPSDNVLFKIFTNKIPSSNGQYEVPIGLTNNPLNGPLSSVTLSEMADHFKTMTEGVPNFVGSPTGTNNSRDLLEPVRYGKRLVSNVNPIAFSNFFIGVKEHNVVDAIVTAGDQYNQFKFALLKKISELVDQTDPVAALDIALRDLNKDKDLNSPWYLSDMVAYGTDKTTRTWTVTDSRNKIYPLTSDFDPTILSLRSVLVYLNGEQLLLNKDYTFNTSDSSIEILKNIQRGDVLVVNDYFSTEGSYVPATPTKLGLYPKFEPSIFVDSTYTTPTTVIQGHDGSITVAYGDFRDSILLEYEKRVYNNIKTQYRHDLFDIASINVGAFRSNNTIVPSVNFILYKDFIRWAGFFGLDYQPNTTFDLENPFTWNYIGSFVPSLNLAVNGNWRNIFNFLYDTDRPHICPWEMLGFSEQPSWWEQEYGPAPYTSGNQILWKDLEEGVIKQGSRAGVDSFYKRPGLSNLLPVDEYGNLVDPSQSIVVNYTPYSIRQNWNFSNQGPVETAWRRSSYFPFAVQRLLALVKPADYCALMYDPAHMRKNIAGQWTYGDKYEFLDLRTVKVHNDNKTLTSGYSVYVSEIGSQRTSNYVSELKKDLQYVDFNLFHKVGGFISKNKLQIIIDAIDPTSTSPGALLPLENYNVILNKGNPVGFTSISGIIVQRSNGKFKIRGYDTTLPYFTVLEPKRTASSPAITVGGVSAPYVNWAPSSTGGNDGLDDADTTTANAATAGQFYQQGQIVRYNSRFYRVKVSHRSGTSFDATLFQEIPELPTTGGATVQLATLFDTKETTIPYGREYSTAQEVYDLIVGYGAWLESRGFIFDDFNSDLNSAINWDLSAKEFLYWTTQNWSDNSIITLSPFANKLKFKLNYSIVDNVFDSFYQYSVQKADGLPFPQNNLNVTRDGSLTTIETINTTEGFYFAKLNSVQKEHALVFDNTTVFNDTIYDIETGYRQRRMKLSGFRTKNWNGDYFSPGFVYDPAVITDWKEFKDYKTGSVVRYASKYYSAINNVPGAAKFDFNLWALLGDKPVAELVPNFEYKINQFEDFYSLDIDNFDQGQQTAAQHLIGYTPRVYLNNVFTNPIAQYKFYQGFIKEKGTKNSVRRIAKATIFNQQGDIDFTEEWALRIGNYGAFSTYQELEVPLQEGSFIENPQVVNFVDTKPVNPVDLIYYNTATDLVIIPDDYSPTTTFATTNVNNFEIPTAGYVSFEDIDATAYNENSLLDIANSQDINEGDVIWLGFKQNGEWDILRYDLVKSKIVGVFVSNPTIDITFVTDTFHGLSVGDVISVNRFNDQVNGVYKVIDITKPNFFTVSSVLPSIINDEFVSPGLLYKFTSVRAANYDSLPSDQQMLKFPFGTKFWVDNGNPIDGYDWKVYEKIDNFTSSGISSGYDIADQDFGFSISKRHGDDFILIGAPGFNTVLDYGRVITYQKGDTTSQRRFAFTLNTQQKEYHTFGETQFGYSVAYSDKNFKDTTYGVMFAGAPVAGNLKTVGSVLKYADPDSAVVSSTEAGAVKISTVNPALVGEVSEMVLVNPGIDPNYSHFGHAITVNGLNNNLFVGAPGTATQNTGTVYFYQNLIPNSNGRLLTSATSIATVLTVSNITNVEAGNRLYIKGYLNDILSSLTVTNVTSVNDVYNVELSAALGVNVPVDTDISFYDTTTLLPTQGIFTTTNGILVTYIGSTSTTVAGSLFGYSLDSTLDGKTVVIGAPGSSSTSSNFVDVIRNPFEATQTIQRITPPVEWNENSEIRFGSAVAISGSGEMLFVTAPDILNDDQSFGKVAVYELIGNTYTYTTSLSNPVSGIGMKFGKAIDVADNTNTVVVSAIGLNRSVPVKFDSNSTSFDSSSTAFYSVIENFGTVYVYNRETGGDRYVLSTELTPVREGVDPDLLRGSDFGNSLVADGDSIFVGAPALDAVTTSSFYQFTQIDTTKTNLNLYKQAEPLVDIETIQKVTLIDTFNERVVDYLDVIDPVKGKISGLADQEIKFKSAFDPAIYSIGTAGVVVDADTSWLDDHVGELWWDLSTVKFVWYEQGSLSYRKNNWGAIFPGSTIDVYEWVRSPLLPSEWSSVADTSAGLIDGVSGQPKYPDNSSISVKQIYNPTSNSFNNVYYYWVRNKVTVPNVKNRRTSALQVASIIVDPTGYGLNYAAFISKDAVALANVGTNLVGGRINLNVAYDKEKNNRPRHTEWTLIEEGSANSMPPTLYEKKLFDSLLGKDSLGNPVPDPSLSERVRYGISIRPRQTLFKDRRAALRNLIEFSNSVLIQHQITGSHSFVNLNSQELPPDEFSREYDLVVEDNEGLNLVETRPLKQAVISCTVFNGKIRSVTILNEGYGYRLPPKVTITGDGTGAEILTEIDNNGRVVGATISNEGQGYTTAPSLLVRAFSVIVLSDNLYNGKWTKFEWDQDTQQWARKQTQRYNTTLYWKYVDYVSPDYNDFVDYSYTVDQVYQLDAIEDIIAGQYVKVKNIGDGRYAILSKIDSATGGTFGKGYDLVYSQNGTIQILDTIWDLVNSDLGWDQNNTYDQTLYDQTPDVELFYILTALKKDLFVDELKINWNLFFFRAIKYAMTEQKLLDWAFKTSFINVTNYAGPLDQRPVYKLQSADNFESYIKEVKPYHSQIRTFTANYQVLEPTNTYNSDFDLPGYYDTNFDKFVSVEDTTDPILQEYPWKSWADNYLYEVGSIVVGSGGSGYTFAPAVKITTAPGDSGSGASAVAYIRSGEVISIEVTNPGSGYRVPPVVTLQGGGDANLVPAVVYAQLYNGKVRNNITTIKFDRIDNKNTIGGLPASDSFVCDGSSTEFTLSWLPEPIKANIVITLDGSLVLNDQYRLEFYTERYNGYTKKFGKIVFTETAPTYGQVLEIFYNKNNSLLNAAERIIEFYTATSGMPGKDLAQLMTGIEYPGVRVQGLTFDYSTDWDIPYSPWGKSTWGESTNYFTELELSGPVVAGTDTVVVSTTTGITIGQVANIVSADKTQSTSTILFAAQVSNKNKDVFVTAINTASRTVKFSSTITESINTTTKSVYVGGTFTDVISYGTVELWNFDSNASALDSLIEGGTWAANSLTGALGINPEDIVIDGDQFISPNTGYAPEELVAGHARDSIGINVYTRYNKGAPVVVSGDFDVVAGVQSSGHVTFAPPNKDSIFVTFGGRNFEYTNNIGDIAALDVSKFYYDWANNLIIVGPQSITGKGGYTVVGIGGGRGSIDAGVIDRSFAVVDDGSGRGEVESLAGTSTVKSAYVTVNGVSIPELPSSTSTEIGYVLTYSNENNKRAAVKAYNLPTTGEQTIQAWFFGSEEKYFNEFKEQNITVTSPQSTFTLTQPPGNIEPAAVNAIVQVNDGSGWTIYQPPFVSYYLYNGSTSTFAIEDSVIHSTVYSPDLIRVYKNGEELIGSLDYTINTVTNTISIVDQVLTNGDALAILSLPLDAPRAEYDIQGTTLTLTNPISNALLKVTTFTNHDDLLLRSERFKGNTIGRFTVNRPIYNENYIWVSVNGRLLVNRIDYRVLEDARTIQLSDTVGTTVNDKILITTVSGDKLAETTLGYRIFNDIFNRTHFKRLSKSNSTVLASPLEFTDTEVHVEDPTVLTPPNISRNIPGVVIIDGERIEFSSIVNNRLKQLRRATLGTSPSRYSPVGTKVIDQGPNQTIPFGEIIKRQITQTSTSTNVYKVSVYDQTTSTQLVDSTGNTIYYNTQTSDGIVFDLNFPPRNQIEVYYGGRPLRKSYTLHQNTEIAYDSPNIDYKDIRAVSSINQLPVTDVIGFSVAVTNTNQVWTYEASLDSDAVKGYVYKGLDLVPQEFTAYSRWNTSTAAAYATSASMTTTDLTFDINGDAIVDRQDIDFYLAAAGTKSVSPIVSIVDPGTAFSSGTTVTFSNPDVVGGITATGALIFDSSGAIVSVSVTNIGSGYYNSATITVTTASAVTNISVTTSTTTATWLYVTTSSYLDSIYTRMVVVGENIPTGTTVVSKNTNSVVLSAAVVGSVSTATFFDAGSTVTSFVTYLVTTPYQSPSYINLQSNYVDLLDQYIQLNIEGGLEDGVELVIKKRQFDRNNVWNDVLTTNTTKTLMDSTTVQAKFLQEKPAELPDIYYYGEARALDVRSGLALTDENDEPLEGL